MNLEFTLSDALEENRHLRQQMNFLLTTLAEVEGRVIASDEELIVLRRGCNDLRTEVDQVRSELVQQKMLNQEMAAKVKEACAQLRASEDSNAKLKVELLQMAKLKSELKGLYHKLDQERKALSSLDLHVKELRVRCERMDIEHCTLRKEQKEHLSREEKLRTTCNSLQSQVAVLQNDKEDLLRQNQELRLNIQGIMSNSELRGTMDMGTFDNRSSSDDRMKKRSRNKVRRSSNK
eukprot:gene474-517_t